MRIASALLCFSIIFSAAWAADPALPSPTDAYIAARDRYIAEFRNLPDRGQPPERAVRALAGVEQLLRAAVPAWSAPGFLAEGKINLDCMDDAEAGFGVLDGLAYSAGDTFVIVTNRVLLTRFLAGHNRRSRAGFSVSIPAAFRSDEFWTFTSCPQAGAEISYFMPVKIPAGADSATVALAGSTQGPRFDNPPDYILAAVVHKDRVWIAKQKLKQPLATFIGCKHSEATERTEKSYLACFPQHLRRSSSYAAVRNQAQALVDMLR